MMDHQSVVDSRIRDFIVVTEVDAGATFAEAIFQRKYRQSVPDFPHHIVALYRDREGRFVQASYVHFNPVGDIWLVGGGCTDGRAFATMNEQQRAAVTAAGGLLLQTLRFGFDKFADRCDAFFGYCGDPRAWEVDLAAGFIPTAHDKLLVKWPRPLGDSRRQEMTARAHALGPF
ncbi:MAG: hypothetical protein WB784_02215 [Rhodanobacteraceae bacterium]